jgi:hypothetical protein
MAIASLRNFIRAGVSCSMGDLLLGNCDCRNPWERLSSRDSAVAGRAAMREPVYYITRESAIDGRAANNLITAGNFCR